MRGIAFTLSVLVIGAAIGAEQGALMRQNQRLTKSFLTAQSFPKTFDDLSFVQKVEVWQEGYEPFETEYDSNGVCIKYCAYPGMTIEDELDMWDRQTTAAEEQLKKMGVKVSSKSEQNTGGTGLTVTAVATMALDAYNPDIPTLEPLKGTPKITSGYGKRMHPKENKCKSHGALDYRAAVGTNVYAPANGTVKSVFYNAKCGNGLKITHGGGFETGYCHLSNVSVSQGDTVSVGQVVAKTGNTGTSDGPHLHYVTKYNGTVINPGALTGRTKAASGC
jgi:murein DD-endopeptidase MepM/ murein hydrolase activator NlpD